MINEAPEIYMKDRTAWRAWLAANHDKAPAIWMIYDKGPERSMVYDDIVEELLCFGWIDSREKRVSDTQTKIYCCPRRAKSSWSERNKAIVERLIASGLMQPAGKAAIEAAQTSGKW